MKVKFIKNYNGALEGRLKRFKEGEIYDVSEKYAKVLLGLGKIEQYELSKTRNNKGPNE